MTTTQRTRIATQRAHARYIAEEMHRRVAAYLSMIFEAAIEEARDEGRPFSAI